MRSYFFTTLKTSYHRFEEWKEKLRDWFLSFSRKPHADGWLAFFSFAEASFFPVPPDFLQIALTLARSRRWALYALIVTLSSVAGGLLGYLIGTGFFYTFGAPIIAFYGLEEEIAYATKIFSEYSFLTIFAAAFTPIPYKVFTIAAGFFNVNIAVFLTASAAGRGVRFFAVGFLVKRYGGKLRYLIYRYFNIASLVLLLLAAMWFVLF